MQRLLWLLGGLVALSLAAALIFSAFSSNMVFFFSPSQVEAGEHPRHKAFRLGGMVEAGSIRRAADGLQADFILTDMAHRVTVRYRGALPDLFGEGQGAVAFGRMSADGAFVAEEVLAKHDENYMPPEVADALAKAAPLANARAGTPLPATADSTEKKTP